MLLTLIVTIIFCYVSSTSRDHERIGLDRRRLEIAHLQYAALVVQDWYPESFSLFDTTFLSGELDKSIEDISKKWYILFSAKYSGKAYTCKTAPIRFTVSPLTIEAGRVGRFVINYSLKLFQLVDN